MTGWARRRIGSSELVIAPLMIGGNVFGWTADREATFAILDAARDAGLDAIDTADQYSCWVPGHVGGESETLIGEWLRSRGRRDQVVLATKVGTTTRGPDGWGADLSADHIVRSVEASLSRLQTDYIDLYQLHLDDHATPLEETLSACHQLLTAGKVRAFGASNYSAARLAEAVSLGHRDGLAKVDAFQTLYNLCERQQFEDSLESVCATHRIGVLCYSSLARGFLTGRYSTPGASARSQWAHYLGRYDDERGHRILTAVRSIAADLGTTPAAVALAWLASRSTVVAPIVAVNDLTQLHEVAAAAELQLTASHLDLLDAASALEINQR